MNLNVLPSVINYEFQLPRIMRQNSLHIFNFWISYALTLIWFFTYSERFTIYSLFCCISNHRKTSYKFSKPFNCPFHIARNSPRYRKNNWSKNQKNSIPLNGFPQLIKNFYILSFYIIRSYRTKCFYLCPIYLID